MRRYKSGVAVALVGLWLLVTGSEPVAQVPQGTIPVAWNAVGDQPGAAISGYRVCAGPTAGAYTICDTVGKITATTVAGLTDCQMWHVAVKALTQEGAESAGWSNNIAGWPSIRVATASPAFVVQGQPREITITGANFMPDTAVDLGGWPGVTVGLVTVDSCNQLRVMVHPTPGAQVGQMQLGIRVGPVLADGKRVGVVVPGRLSVTERLIPFTVDGGRRTDVR